MTTALDVARYLVELASQEPVPEGLTNSRLQSLLYYAQGWHLGSFDRPLFGEKIELAPNGPVVGEAARAIEAAVGADPTRVVRPGELGPCELPSREQQFVAAIWEKYRGCSAAGLRTLIQQERAWIEIGTNRMEVESGSVSHAALRMYYLRRDELRNFNPREWEAATRGEAEYRRGEGVPLADAMRRLRERTVSTPSHADGGSPVAGSSALPT
jgi:uncharacterized phage-associated protein